MEATTAGSRDTRPPGLRRPPVPAIPRPARPRDDPDQVFVATLRAAAPRFAAAAGAATALVAEAVTPARHRRARCRVVLLAADGTASVLTFLGAAGSPTAGAPTAFAAAIAAWLATDAAPDPGGEVDLRAERRPT